MSKILLQLLIVSCTAQILLAGGDTCNTNIRSDCGYVGINQQQCEAKGCCWVPGDGAWCFFKSGADTCKLDFSAQGNQFTEDNFNTMYGYFLKNINIAGKGGVVAAPDLETPGGSYYYHWERDAALTMRTFMYINGFELDKIEDHMKSYTNWVLNYVQSQSNPNSNDIDPRSEVKYYLTHDGTYGAPFAGGWCRPQNDGPGLRAIALIKFAQVLLASGKQENIDYVKQNLWTDGDKNGGAIKYDLAWAVDNWQTNTCDLWEEIRSTDLFWNRITVRHAMILGAEFAKQMGDSNLQSTYLSKVKDIEASANTHWNNEFIQEETNRQKDGGVICGFNYGYADDEDKLVPEESKIDEIDYNYLNPVDVKIAKTVKAYNENFCAQFQINQIDNEAKIPGILYGRYPGDHYAGGNPWDLFSGALARLFYRGSSYILKNGLTSEQKAAWSSVLSDLNNSSSNSDMANVFQNAGDSVMQRLYHHVSGDDFHLNEQIDRNTGKQLGASDLTWSYAEVLAAVYSRQQLAQEKMDYFRKIAIKA